MSVFDWEEETDNVDVPPPSPSSSSSSSSSSPFWIDDCWCISVDFLAALKSRLIPSNLSSAFCDFDRQFVISFVSIEIYWLISVSIELLFDFNWIYLTSLMETLVEFNVQFLIDSGSILCLIISIFFAVWKIDLAPKRQSTRETLENPHRFYHLKDDSIELI